jgi:hypothetical protein
MFAVMPRYIGAEQLLKKCPARPNTALPETLFQSHRNASFDAASSSLHRVLPLPASWHGPCDIAFEPNESSPTNQQTNL